MVPWTILLLVLSSWTAPRSSVNAFGGPVKAATLEDRRPVIFRSGPDWVVLDQSPINGKVSLFATDPHYAGRLYAGGLGIFRSDDFGETWLSLNQDLRPTILVADPSAPDRLYAVSTGSIWRSDDAGATLRPIAGPPNSVTSFLVDAAGTLYAVGLEGAFKSATAGDSWSPITSVGRLVAADPITPRVLYALSFNFLPASESIFKTTDGAASWTGPIFGVSQLLGQSLGDLRISPTAPITVHLVTFLQQRAVCAGTVMASRDGGATWKAVFSSAGVGPIAADPIRPSVLYVGTFGPCGSNPDPGGVFQASSSTGRFAPLGQQGFVVQNLAVAPDGSILYAVAGGKFAVLRLPPHTGPAAIPFR